MAAASHARSWTFAGLFIALFGLPAIVACYRLVVDDPTGTGNVVLRETAILALVALLLWIVVSRERLPLSSIGIGGRSILRSLAWGLAIFLALAIGLAACLGAFQLVGLTYGTGGMAISVSLWATLLTVIRAGVAEEVFYRGYAIERIEALTGSRWIAILLPLIAFAAFHYRQGLAGVIIALVLGGIMTAFYVWKRDLVANICGHFLIDFIPNVLLPLLGGD